MADENDDLGDNELTDRAFAVLEADPNLNLTGEEDTARARDPETGRFAKSEAEAASEEGEADAEDAAPEEASGDEEEEQAEPETAIDPPSSWTAEAKEVFAKLPPDLQSYVAERESERERGLNSKLSEAAESRKRHESEIEAAKQERQKYAETLQAVTSFAQAMDPIIAEGDQTDWAKAHEEDPIGTPAKWFAYQQRRELLQRMQHEAQQAREKAQADFKSDQEAKLAQWNPDFADPVKGKAKRDSYVPVLSDAGFSPDEINGFWNGFDHRYVKVLELAAEGQRLKAAQKALAQKKVAQPVKVAKPKGGGDEKPAENPRITALRKQAEKTRSTRDIADLATAILMEG